MKLYNVCILTFNYAFTVDISKLEKIGGYHGVDYGY